MNAGQRKAIRDHVKNLIGVVPGAEVFTFKKAKLENDTPAICVYLEEGDADLPGMNGVLAIRVMHPDENDVDDKLDALGDIVQQAIESAAQPNEAYQYTVEVGFEYDRDGTESWTGLDIRYLVNY
ncbi:Phage minor tail protein U [Amphritea atlantica]|uniref:Phage minor tail protein U n=1 Tax=Amphritea atlantica TaxID=355243 RepID=A0A1H9GGH7_9GAMM|nr:hypothetical protein [Amphritea atlantica]SEQ49194.1 Phage minor tail protein U [Amphritea atlantica]